MGRPNILVTPGDPAGIGPEITIKALVDGELYSRANIFVVCHPEIIEKTADILNLKLRLNCTAKIEDFKAGEKVINILSHDNQKLPELIFGMATPEYGRLSYSWISRAVRLTLNGGFDALVTGPVNKEALKEGGIKQFDHTSVLKELTGAIKVGVMFEVDRLRIFFLTRHLSLMKAIAHITVESVYEGIVDTVEFLKMLGENEPVIGVAALNPHGGEGGMFGDEEIRYIRPAVERARKSGFNVRGPFPADSIFYRGLNGEFSGVLSLYHDQGHIAAKTYNFEKTVSVTIGLPFIRTSVDHGTAYDIAGKGLASPVGMKQAILSAVKYVPVYTPPRR